MLQKYLFISLPCLVIVQQYGTEVAFFRTINSVSTVTGSCLRRNDVPAFAGIQRLPTRTKIYFLNLAAALNNYLASYEKKDLPQS
jgi:hypothetical protein